MHPTVGLESGVVPERLATGVTDIRPAVRVSSHVGDHGQFVSEEVSALLALPGPTSRVLQQVVLQVGLGFESLITVGAVELPDIFVDGIDVGLQSALLREILPTEFTPNL